MQDQADKQISRGACRDDVLGEVKGADSGSSPKVLADAAEQENGDARGTCSVDASPRVSVVIPTYKRPRLVARAIDSVLRQTYRDFELIVVDDCSPDDTAAVVRAIADPRIHYVRHENNKGLPAVRNTGIRAARGEFIAFLDDDDQWREDKLAKQLAAISGYDAVACTAVSSADGYVLRLHRGPGISLEDLRRGSFAPSGLLARTSALRDVWFDETLRQGEDWDAFIRFAQRYSIGWVADPLLIYNEGQHDRMTSEAKAQSPAELEKRTAILHKHRQFFGEKWFRFHVADTFLGYIRSRPDRFACLMYAVQRCGLTPVAQSLYQKLRRWVRRSWTLRFLASRRPTADSSSVSRTPVVGGGAARPRVLFVPGFVADTYSEIERSLVELCAAPGREVEFVWLVPDIGCKYNSFARAESRSALSEPAFVPHLRSAGVPYVVGSVSKYDIFGNFLLFRRVFRQHQIDVVYTHFGYERFWAAFFGKIFGKVVLWNEHWQSLAMRYAGPKRIFYRWFVDEFVAVSAFIARTLPQQRSVHTVPNAIRVEASEKPIDRVDGIEQFWAHHGIKVRVETRVILMVAAFTQQKRHALALEVCDRILSSGRDAIFVFLGDGPHRLDVLDAARIKGFADRVVAPGYVSNVDEYYQAAHICMLTSKGEGFGYAVLEAMKHGRPAVVFDSGALPELVRDGVTGFIVPDGDVHQFVRRVLQLIDDPASARSMGQAARQVAVEKHRRDLWIANLRTVIGNAASSRRAPAYRPVVR